MSLPLYNVSEMMEAGVFVEYVPLSTSFCSQYKRGHWYCYVLLPLFSVALPVGIVGNLAALVNYTFYRKSSSTSHVFLLHLALCDSAWILTLPFTIYFSVRRPYLRYIQIFCQFKKVFFTVNIYGSILFLTLISFDRYAGTVHPISSLQWWDVGKAKLCSALAWVLLALGSIPDLFVTFGVRRPGNATACMDHIQGPFAYVRCIAVVRTLVGFLLPLAVMLALYGMTLRVLRRLGSGRGGGGGGKGGIGGGGKRKPMRLIAVALLVFVVSFTPYHAMVITLVFMRLRGEVTAANADLLYAAFEFFEAMCSVSCCLDPLLYILDSERVQRRLRALRRGRYGRLCRRGDRRVGVVS
ncbi:P2Y purinoceptor 1-like [Gadus chalcogrammus]|uniref:P2Y purinoceptor 1-like n=1 Tax=Gadus chalcogrammus TaxID=1042646 RepID=UPI0024C4BE1C|nr:P2Y purinoceptor 1-like [Gadus chalcogrammus]